jgi:regulatory protein
MARRKDRRERPPLDRERLNELALAYVGRFATTRSKLASYLGRKLRERGWAGDRPADIEPIVERLAELGYIDDAAYALSKSRALTGRGYGARRVRQSLRAAGVGEEDSRPARELAESEAVEAALRFARRRRMGPFGDSAVDRAGKERALAAMIRAGHGFELARAILSLEPGSEVDIELLTEKA